MNQEPMNLEELEGYYTSYTLKHNISMNFDSFVSLVKTIELHHDIYDDTETIEALENIENEIIARACRTGNCED